LTVLSRALGVTEFPPQPILNPSVTIYRVAMIEHREGETSAAYA
jgi:hypothetical protein